jgi:hypothetical protein
MEHELALFARSADVICEGFCQINVLIIASYISPNSRWRCAPGRRKAQRMWRETHSLLRIAQKIRLVLPFFDLCALRMWRAIAQRYGLNSPCSP